MFRASRGSGMGRHTISLCIVIMVLARTASPWSGLSAPVSPARPIVQQQGEASLALQRIGASNYGTEQTVGNYGANVHVAVIDTGVALHSALQNVVSQAVCGVDASKTTAREDTNSHGTAVAGVIGGSLGSSTIGVSLQAIIHAIKLTDGDQRSLQCALEEVLKYNRGKSVSDPSRIAVVNISLAWDATVLGWPAPLAYQLGFTLCQLLDSGVRVVTGAGGELAREGQAIPSNQAPANYPGVLEVAALADSDGTAGHVGGRQRCSLGQGEFDDTLWSGSSYGPPTFIAAPGVCVATTGLNNSVNRDATQTSFAAPFVAGAAALYLEQNRTATSDQVRSYLLAMAEKPGVRDPAGNNVPVLHVGPFGRAVTWGEHDGWPRVVDGVLGDIDVVSSVTTRSPVAQEIAPGTIKTMSAGLALTADGHVYDWTGGPTVTSSVDSQLNPTTSVTVEPITAQLVAGLDQVVAIAYDWQKLALRADGTVLSWGRTLQNGTHPGEVSTTPTALTFPDGARIVAIAAGGYHNLALNSGGTVYAWGWNWAGTLGIDDVPTGDFSTPEQEEALYLRLAPQTVVGTQGRRVVGITAGGQHSLAVTDGGAVYGWGHDDYHQSGAPANASCLAVPCVTKATLVPDLRTCPGFGIVGSPQIPLPCEKLDGYVPAPDAGRGGTAAPGLPERPDRRPMGAAGALAAGTRPGGPRAAGKRRFARDRQRAAVYQTDRLPLALPAA